MAVPVHVPRVNNNDDEVKLIELKVAVGDRVQAGQVLGCVETDKAMVDIECPADGFVLAVQAETDTQVVVGTVLLWLGATADEVVPQVAATPSDSAGDGTGRSTPTAKALALLKQYGLTAAAVRASGDRLSAEDVRQHVAGRGLRPHAAGTAATAAAPAARALPPSEAGQTVALSGNERGMLHTVSWQRDVAVPGYIELHYDHAAWEAHAAAYSQEHQLLLNPLLPLMAWRLVELVAQQRRANATLANDHRHEYDHVNLGFTVQAGDTLYLAVLRQALQRGRISFVQDLVDLQRRAAAHELQPSELQGATVGFSSMSRWKVARHVPILAPNTALMVAHTVGTDGVGVLGATYDHRVLHGGDVATLLRKLGTVPKA